ncbi:hypothetical protein FACS18942_03020 [Planctomycetales bacterium]|nr:hypothetical protein FACS18942_03020 [Planctomycetales bacterium]
MSSLNISYWKTEDILALVRGHWQVENCLHLIKDRWRDDDKHLLSRPGVVFTSMLNAALSVSRFLKKKNEPMTAVAAKIRDKPKNILKLLDS